MLVSRKTVSTPSPRTALNSQLRMNCYPRSIRNVAGHRRRHRHPSVIPGAFDCSFSTWTMFVWGEGDDLRSDHGNFTSIFCLKKTWSQLRNGGVFYRSILYKSYTAEVNVENLIPWGINGFVCFILDPMDFGLVRTWNAKCPIFLGNFTPKTSNYCLSK